MSSSSSVSTTSGSNGNTTIVVISSGTDTISGWMDAATITVGAYGYNINLSSLWKWSAIILFCSFTGVAIHRYFTYLHTKKRLANIKEIKTEQRQRQLAAVQSYLNNPPLTQITTQERQILACSARQLIAKILAKETGYSCQSVLIAFIRQTMRLQNKCNILTEVCFKEAIEQSQRLDQQLQGKSTSTTGKLYGIPISLKDSVGVAGLDTTLGVVGYANDPALNDSLIVRLLRAQGAQIYTKTNVPQTLISFECSNPLYGRSVHLQSSAYTPGGSSGGESVLIAGHGSILGIGTDIGGSVRIPAHFSGHAALKCTSRRISTVGFRTSVPGQEAVVGVAGVMGRYTDDLILLLSSLLVPEAWAEDSELVPLSLNQSIINNSDSMVIGYYVDDGFLASSPSCARGVLETIHALTAAGHRCVPFMPPRMLDAIALYYALLSADGGHTMTDQLRGEEWEDYVIALSTAVNIPIPIKHIVSAILRSSIGKHDERAATLFSVARKISVNRLWKLQNQRKLYRQEFFALWSELGLDAIICPPHVLPAIKHGDYKKISFTCSYTLLYNILDCPAGIVPVTTVQSTDVYTADMPVRGLLDKAARSCYDPIGTQGFPIGIQVVGRPYQDEVVLRLMKEIEQLIPFTPANIEW